LGLSFKAFQNHPHPVPNHHLTGEHYCAYFGATVKRQLGSGELRFRKLLYFKPQFAYSLVGEAGRFRQAVFDGTTEGYPDCIFEQALIADRDKQRLYIGPRSYYSADGLALIFQQ